MPDRNARVWTGSAWENISAPIGIPNAVAVFQPSAPSSPVTGQLWVDQDDNRIYVWNGSSWAGATEDLSAYATKASPTFTGAGGANGGTVVINSTLVFTDGTTSEGRMTSSGDTFYIQAGTGSGDTTAKLNIARNTTTSTNISQFNIYSDATSIFGDTTISKSDASTTLTIRNNSSTTARYPQLQIINYNNTGSGFPALEFFNSRGSQASPTASQSGDTLGGITGWAWDGTSFNDVARIYFIAENNFTNLDSRGIITFNTKTGTTLSERMRINSSGNIGIGTNSPSVRLDVSASSNQLRISQSATDSYYGFDAQVGYFDIKDFTDSSENIRLTNNSDIRFTVASSERMRIASSGSVLIGRTYGSNTSKIGVGGSTANLNASSSTFYDDTIISSNTTGSYTVFSSYPSTAAASFTLPSLTHYRASQFTIGAGSTVTNQYGFFVDGSLIGATNNYGIYSGIQSGTNRWNIYIAGTANNYFAGNVGIGIASPSNRLEVATSSGDSVILSTGPSTSAGYIAANGNGRSGLTGAVNLISYSSGVAELTNRSNAALIFGTNNTERMRITSAGDIGIGVSPASNMVNILGKGLEVTRNSAISYIDIISNGVGGYLPSMLSLIRRSDTGGATPNSTNLGEIRFSGLDTNSSYALGAAILAATGVNAAGGIPTDLVFHTATSGAQASERMRITASGRVGIGASNPQEVFSITGSSGTNPAMVFEHTNQASYKLGIDGQVFKIAAMDNGFGGHSGSFVNNDTQVISMTTTGNVGIGRSSSSLRLSVAGTSSVVSPTLGSATGSIFISNNDIAYGTLVGVNGATGATWIQSQRVDGPATAYDIILQPAGGNIQLGSSSGRIQIPAGGILEAPVSTNAQTGTAYTLVLTDAGRVIEMNNAAANTLTVPTDASVNFPVGTVIDIFQTGAGQTTVGGAGVTINARPGLKLSGQWATATLIKRAANTWLLTGSLSA